ncbi:MAG: hypothetical protein FMNOHCHN_00077 [Ignavibacteriaceae bacterium]|nr:hypothetical protein [Ignavibacteriaceae bacterium]
MSGMIDITIRQASCRRAFRYNRMTKVIELKQKIRIAQDFIV